MLTGLFVSLRPDWLDVQPCRAAGDVPPPPPSPTVPGTVPPPKPGGMEDPMPPDIIDPLPPEIIDPPLPGQRPVVEPGIPGAVVRLRLH